MDNIQEYVIPKELVYNIIDLCLDERERTLFRLVNKEFNNYVEDYVNIYTLIKNGNLGTLQYIWGDRCIKSRYFGMAIEYGHLHIMKWMKERGYNLNNSGYVYPKYLQLDILQWLFDNNVKLSFEVSIMAASMARLDVLQWLHTTNQLHIYAFNGAVKSCHLHIMKWLVDMGYAFPNKTLYYAASYCNVETMEWLDTMGCNNYAGTMHLAIRNGNIQILDWLYEKSIPLDDVSLVCAIESCNINIVEWVLSKTNLMFRTLFDRVSIVCHKNTTLEFVMSLYDKGLKYDKFTFSSAVNYGHLCIMKWLKDMNCEWDKDCFKYPECVDSTSVIEWLFENKYNLPKNVLQLAVEKCRLSDIKLLRQYGVSWNGKEFETAIKHDDFHIIKWLCQNKCPRDEKDLITVVERCKFNTIRCVIDYGYIRPYNYCFIVACQRGDLSVVEYLYSKLTITNSTFLIREDPMYIACKNGYLNILKFLTQKHFECRYYNLNAATSGEYMDMVQYLLKIYDYVNDMGIYSISSNKYPHIKEYLDQKLANVKIKYNKKYGHPYLSPSAYSIY